MALSVHPVPKTVSRLSSSDRNFLFPIPCSLFPASCSLPLPNELSVTGNHLAAPPTCPRAWRASGDLIDGKRKQCKRPYLPPHHGCCYYYSSCSLRKFVLLLFLLSLDRALHCASSSGSAASSFRPFQGTRGIIQVPEQNQGEACSFLGMQEPLWAQGGVGICKATGPNVNCRSKLNQGLA